MTNLRIIALVYYFCLMNSLVLSLYLPIDSGVGVIILVMNLIPSFLIGWWAFHKGSPF